MKKIISIISAKYIDDFKINLVFDDKHSLTINFYDFLSQSKLPDLQKYKNKRNFKKFKIMNGNLIWGDYEMIFPLEDLYFDQLIPQSKNIKRVSNL